VSANKMLRRIFILKREEVTAGWRKVHNVELHSIYCPARMIKSRRMRWVGM
jgi:hypothetical protein